MSAVKGRAPYSSASAKRLALDDASTARATLRPAHEALSFSRYPDNYRFLNSKFMLLLKEQSHASVINDVQQPQAGVEQKASVFIPKTPWCSFGERVMNTTKKARKASEDPLFAKSSAWKPPYQTWQERAKSTRKLVERLRDGQAKNLLILIAETYERLAHPP